MSPIIGHLAGFGFIDRSYLHQWGGPKRGWLDYDARDCEADSHEHGWIRTRMIGHLGVENAMRSQPG